VAHPALIEAVHRRTEETIAAVWAEARAEAERCGSEARRDVEGKRAALDLQLRAISTQTLRAALRAAERQARAIRAAARAALAERLLALARRLAGDLRNSGYPAHFRALAAELPARAWTRIIVNPADADMARELFTGCDIVSDAAITAGLVAEGDGLRATNTFNNRLAAAWPDLQPAVMSHVIHHHQSPRATA
jgi:vacuolar-type H+-ATPase subunit E/Vma4